MENHHAIKNGKPSISIRAIEHHGYVIEPASRSLGPGPWKRSPAGKDFLYIHEQHLMCSFCCLGSKR